MLISFLLLALIASGGVALTYVIARDEPLMWRLSAGSIVGSTAFGVIAFTAACLIGFNAGTIIGSLIITMLPLLLMRQPEYRSRFRHDWAKAKGKFQGVNAKKLLGFAYYVFFFLVFWFFFDRAAFQMADGIHTGGTQNLGDLPLHLGAITSFVDGNNFPPQNPSWAGAKFAYPFMSDFLTATMVKLGAELYWAIFAQNLTWAFALLVILERFAAKITNSRIAGRIAPALLFFTGGLGFIWFFKDVGETGKGVTDLLWHLPKDYTISDTFRWGNSMVVLFITQRGLLFGMPLTVLVLNYLWKIFAFDETEDEAHVDKPKKTKSKKAQDQSAASPLFHFFTRPLGKAFLVGLAAGTLPLVHVHSLAALFVVTAILFALHPAKWQEWIAFGVGTALIAVPELVWTMVGSATNVESFYGWHYGWNKHDDESFWWFWFRNTGLAIPLLLAGLWLCFDKIRRGEEDDTKHRDKDAVTEREPRDYALLFFYIPFAALFLICNVTRLAPWDWDNIKVLIYWFVGSAPFIALALSWGWRRGPLFKYAAILCLVVLTLAGAIDTWRTASRQYETRVFDNDGVKVAEQIKQKTAPNALFLNAPTFNTAVALSGRQSLMRYSGHLSSYGINFMERENEVRQIYQGTAVADTLLQKYNIDYVMVSPEEKGAMKANEEYFKKYPVIAESGQYKVYKVKQ
jgi:hypothetical protein